MATVLLARHGQTTWNDERRLQGWAPSRLTDHGHEQAAALAERLSARDPDRLVSSDLQRSLDTADRVADATGLTVAPDRAWREHDCGFLQGLPVDEAFERFPRLSVDRGEAALTERPEGGETLQEFADRVTAGWEALRAELGPDETAVVVTHNGALETVLARVADRSLIESYRSESHPNCAVTEVRTRPAETTVVRRAATDHLSLD